MEIIFDKDLNSNLHVKAAGKLDIDTAAEYGMKINDALDDYSGTKELFLDFSQITYVASIVAEVLKMTGFDKFLKVS